MAPYTLRGQKFTCEDWLRLPSGKCPIETGEEVLRLYKLDGNAAMNVTGLGICAIVYRVLAYLVLKGERERWLGRGWEWFGGFGKKKSGTV